MFRGLQRGPWVATVAFLMIVAFTSIRAEGTEAGKRLAYRVPGRAGVYGVGSVVGVDDVNVRLTRLNEVTAAQVAAAFSNSTTENDGKNTVVNLQGVARRVSEGFGNVMWILDKATFTDVLARLNVNDGNLIDALYAGAVGYSPLTKGKERVLYNHLAVPYLFGVMGRKLNADGAGVTWLTNETFKTFFANRDSGPVVNDLMTVLDGYKGVYVPAHYFTEMLRTVGVDVSPEMFYILANTNNFGITSSRDAAPVERYVDASFGWAVVYALMSPDLLTAAKL
jgi:hypothetical protein